MSTRALPVQVREVDLQVTVLQQATSPLYIPAYVFTRTLPASGLQAVAAAVMRTQVMQHAA
jgi:hypothetical protein